MHGWVYTRAEKTRWCSHGLIHGWGFRRVGLLTEFYSSPHGQSPECDEYWTFGDGQFCVQLCIETLCKWATSVAHLTDPHPLNFLCAFHRRCFSTLSMRYSKKKKPKNDQKLKSRRVCHRATQTKVFVLKQWWPCAYVILYGKLPPSQSFCGYCWVAS